MAIDAPQGNLIARLCDVHPDGSSHRITLGVLNLSHRNGSEHPSPMTPGVTETVTITLDATAYRLRKGHRLRLALSTNYFPLVLPPPTEVTATIDLAQSELRLPSHPFKDVEVAEGSDNRPHYPREFEKLDRIVEAFHASQEYRSSLVSTGGHIQHPENEIEWMDVRGSHWTIKASDPLALNGAESCDGKRWRDGVETVVSAEATMTVSAGFWNIETRLAAFEDNEKVFDRTWTDHIPRDHT